MKKTLALLLATIMVLTLIPITGTAQAEDEIVTLKVMGYERNLQDIYFADRDEYPLWQEAEKIFAQNGVAFEFEIIADSTQYTSTIQTRLASNYDLPDLAYLGTLSENVVLDIADVGTILPMNEVLATTKGPAYDYFETGYGQRARNLITSEDGNYYWLPRIQTNLLEGDERGTSIGPTIRLDWLEILGLDIPQTLDEYTDALRAFQENDMNGNGVKDEVVAIDTATFNNGISLWFGMVNGFIGVDVTEGTAESAWYSPAAKDYFAYVQQLVSEGLLYPDAIGSETYDDATKSLRNENKVSSVTYYPVGTYIENEVRLSSEEGTQGKDCYYIGIYPFSAVDGVDAYYSEETPYLVYLKYGVTIAAEDKLEAVARAFDTIYTDEFINMMVWGIEGVTYEVVEGENKSFVRGVPFADLASSRTAMPDHLWRHFFPTVYFNERLDEIQFTSDGGWEAKAEFEFATKEYPKKTANDNSTYYAMPTTEQNEILSRYLTDLTSFSRELGANLSLGRASLDDWDAHIDELKEYGLDEVLAVRQDQVRRAFGK